MRQYKTFPTIRDLREELEEGKRILELTGNLLLPGLLDKYNHGEGALEEWIRGFKKRTVENHPRIYISINLIFEQAKDIAETYGFHELTTRKIIKRVFNRTWL